MSYAQRRLYFLQKLRPDSPAYNVVEAVRLTGSLNQDAIRVALAAVVERHEVLRTRCAEVDGEPILKFFDSAALDQSSLLEVVEHRTSNELAEDFARRLEEPFDLETEFPLRVTLARLSQDDHALLFVAHHIASDAWSCRLMLGEFFRTYTAALSRTTEVPPPLAMQYADFAAWQRSRLEDGGSRADLAYWRRRLQGMPPLLELPLEHPRPSVRSDHAREIHFDVDPDLRRDLDAAAKDASVTPFALLLTAFGFALHRYCSTDDVVVGAPVSGRERVEVEHLLGCFINTVVLRLDFTAASSRRALVQRVWERTLEDFEHQQLPFELLVSELNPERDLSTGQLVQVMFNYYPATELRDEVPGLDVAPLAVERKRAKFDLTCTIVEARESMRVTLNYATELLDPSLVRALGKCFLAVLDALIADLDAPPETLPLEPPSEAQASPVREAGATPTGTVLDLFEAHAKTDPEGTAIRSPSEAISYGDLNRRANRLARYLGARESGSGPVGLLFERSIDYVTAMLAALKAGRAYVPLDPAMPPAHVASVLREAGSDLMLTHVQVDRSEIVLTGAAEVDVIALEDIDSELSALPASNLDGSARPDDAMYVLFTSGSTGQPKGVVVEHRHFASYLSSLLDRMAITQGLSFAIVSTFAADLGLTNLYGALASGGTLHVLPYEWSTDPDRFARYFEQHRIDFMKLVPSHLKAIAEAGLLEAVIPHRHLVLAGEACPWELVDAVRTGRPHCSIWNHYGPTETTVSVLAYEVPHDSTAPRGATVPLGFPLSHVRVHVVDRHLRPVPWGAAGELLIGGESVARGYLHTSDAVSDRFLRDPFSHEPGARVYRSGDRVRVRRDGSIEFLGRMDRQAKIRGYRVEPSHVEAVLRQHPNVTDVAVAVRDNNDGRAALVAYYLLDPGKDGIDSSSLSDFARSSMPPYMAPSFYVKLEQMPLTPNGKVDWNALPEPDPHAPRDRPPQPARDERDERVVAIWCDVLGLEDLGIDDDFFELGGDSFAAMKVARLLGEGVRVVSLFQQPTVRRLVDYLGRTEAGGYLCRLPGPSATSVTTASVVAVPFGGGTAAAYGDLAKALPPGFPLYAVELPGHDPGEPNRALESFEVIAAGCVEEIRRTISGPVIVYGHCVGAALAFDIARRLEDAGADVVGVVAGGAFPSPRLPGRLFELWAKLMPSDRWRSDRLYRDMLRSIGGLTDLLGPDEQAFSLRALRHDSRESEDLYSRLCHDGAHRKAVPALSVVGERDRITEFHQERHREWNMLCASTGLAVIPDAGHYFLKHQPDQLAGIIVEWAADRLQGSRPLEATSPEDRPAPETALQLEDPVQRSSQIGPQSSAPPASSNLRGFALVTFGQLISLIGSRAFAFALGIWVYLETGSVTQFSAILVMALLPGLLVLPFAGAAADRWDRRRLMMTGELTNAVGTGFCLGALALGDLQFWHIYVAASFGSIASSFQQPAYLAAVAQLVPKQYLARTNGVQQAVVALSQAIGPLLGGTLIVLVGIGGVMVVDLATVCIALFTLSVVRFPDLLFRKREETIWQEIRGGARYIARRRSLVAMISFFLAYNLFLGFALVLIPPMILSFASAGTLSLAAMLGAVGGVTGGVFMALWGGFARRATGMVGFVLLTGFGMIVAGMQPSAFFPIAGFAAIMASIALINGHWQTMIQLKVGMELQGRILATNRMTANLTEPLGYVAAGWLADKLFEPAMVEGGLLAGPLGGLLGSGPGRGMALMIVLLGIVQVSLAVVGLRWRTLRYMEDALPDAIPGAVVTWDREVLQREADMQLAAASSPAS